MQSFMITLLTCSIIMSMLSLLYMAVMPLLAKRYSEKGRYYAWLVVVVGLIIPFRPQFDSAFIKVDVPSETAAPVIQVGNGTPVTVKNAVLSPVSSGISWWQAVTAVWLAGVITFLVYYAIKHYRFTKMVRRWSESITDKQTLTLLQSLKTETGISKQINLYLCSCIGSPTMIGFANPRILLPKTDFAQDELRFILIHELIHYKRKDLWYKCLVLVATAIHWFNPIVYLAARMIGVQCELSCDAEIVQDADMNMRQQYSETIIGVVKYQSKMKTALSTNFFGGKKGMKKRIFSIMDMSKKKAGFAVLCGVLILTLGTGFAFAAKAETQGPPEIVKEEIKENITVSPDFSYAYKFLPDPEIYAKYSSYGITISDDGEMLLYNGQRVRLFVDEHSDVEVFFLDEAGTIDLAVIRNAAGNITGIESISEDKAQEYRSAFFADDLNTANNPQDIIGQNKYEQNVLNGLDEKIAERMKVVLRNRTIK